MNKLFTKIAALALGATMAVGVGVAVASNSEAVPVHAATTTYQHVFNAKPSTGNNVTLSSVSWNITATQLGAYNSGNYAGVQIGTSKADGSITLTSSSAWGGQSGTYKDKTVISEVRLWLNLGGTSVTPTVTIGGVSATSDGTTVVKNSSAGTDWTKATKVTFTPASNGNTGVVVVNVSTVKAGYICCLEIDCEEPGSSTIPVTGVTLNKNSTTINVGANETLTPTISPADATNKNVTWSSSNSSIASVDEDGVVTGVAAGGPVTITVTTVDGSHTATCSVTVNQPIYTITYNANGASGTTTDLGNNHVNSNSFTFNSGAEFVKWNTAADGTGANYAAGDVVTGNLTLYCIWGYRITYKANGGTGSDVVDHTLKGTSYTIQGCSFTAPDGKEFSNWNTNSAGTGADYAAGGTIATPSGAVDLFAKWVKAPTYEWVLESLANLTSSDVFVVVGDNGSKYALSNNNGTSSAPTAVSVTVANDKITTSVTDSIKWKVTGNASDGYVFSPNGDSSSFLYNTDTNNGVRVGTPQDSNNKVYTINSGYLYNANNSRYVGIYNSSDWRCYGSITGTSNIKGQTFSYYKAVAASTEPAITDVSISGGPESTSVVGGTFWTMSATVTAINDDEEPYILSRDVNWTVSPAGAVTFSKSTSASGEEITVTAVNTANSNVVITAASAESDFDSVSDSSDSFNIVKSYNVNTNTVVTQDGESEYDAGGSTSKVVTFVSAMTYTGDAGTYSVDLSVSPASGATLSSSSITSSTVGVSFTVTFTKTGSYTITATPTEAPSKASSVSVTITNIVVPGYELTNDASSLRNGSQILIYTTGDNYKELMAGQYTSGNSAYRQYVSYTASDNFIPETAVPNSAEIITLVTSGAHWNLKTSDNKYLSLTNSENKIYTVDSLNGESTQWDITFTGDNANIIPVTQTARSIRFNTASGQERFACYAGTGQAVQIYLKIDTTPYFSVNTTSVFLGNRGSQTLQLTAHNGASDTVTWYSSNAVVSVSPTSGLSTTVTAADTGTGVSTVTATFASGNFDPIEVIVEVMELDTYVNIGVTTFTKVTSNDGDWSGTYLLVDETANKIFDGSASPLAATSEKDVTISSSTIIATSSMIASSFNIKTSTNGYTLKSNSNYYVGNRSTSNGIMTSLGVAYEVSIANNGTVTALLQDGTTSGTSLRHNNSDHIFRFYGSDTGNALALYKANGEMRAISDTLTDFYDAIKSNEYLNCNMSGSGSQIDFESMLDLDEFDALTTEDFDTLKRMTAKPSEDNGNYLEDLISDYDYLVQYKGADDIFYRFDEGGAMYGSSRAVPIVLINVAQTNSIAIIVVITMISATAIGGYFFLRKRKEQ